MFAVDFTASLILGALVALSLYWGVGWRHPMGRVAFMPTLVYLAGITAVFTWASGVWLPPFGPMIRGLPLLSFLLPALFMGLLLASLRPARHAPPATTPVGEPAVASRTVPHERVFNVYFVAFTVGLFVFTVIGYLA